MNTLVLMPIDTFTIINRTILHDSDRKNLIMLYQPIVGANAINLYFTFWMYLDQNEFMTEAATHKQLINYMGLSLAEIEEARKYLEAIGLIKTFVKSKEFNEYLIELYCPKPASEFFSNPLLCTALHTALGNVDYNKTKNSFKIPNIDFKNYKNISVNFQDMYSACVDISIDNSNMRKRNYERIGVNVNLDVDKLILSIPEVTSNHIDIPEDIKRHILLLSFLYKYNESILVQLIKNSIVGKKSLDKKTLINNFLNYYKFEHDNKLPQVIKKTQPMHLRKEIKGSDKKAKLIYYFENIDPITHLCKKTNVKRLSDIYITTINHLMFDIELQPGVINVLIDYVLNINNNKLTKNFIEAIANDWKRANIITVEQAMDHALAEKKKREKDKVKVTSKTYQPRQLEKTPEWFDKELEENEDALKSMELDELINNL